MGKGDDFFDMSATSNDEKFEEELKEFKKMMNYVSIDYDCSDSGGDY